ncbi:MAG: hypothetical protein K8H86_06975, partial [Ignavibacteriaceae bacterium]|nr:hypothetical protein [Ignavibacteriaceae bacterium]
MKTKVFVLIMILLVVAANAQQKKPFTIEDVYRVKNVGSPVVSPSGKLVLFTVNVADLKEGKSNTDIYLMNIDGSGITNLTDSDKNEYSPFWSATDEKFYFMQSGQVYLYDIEEEESKQITDFYTGVESPVLSNDGKFILFSSEVYPECGADNPCNEKISKSAADGPVQAYIADNLMYRHWTSY